MGQAIPSRQPAVVPRSYLNQVRALLAVALIAVVGLTVTAFVLATDDKADTSPATWVRGAPAHTADTRYDGGPEEGTRGIRHSSAAAGAGLPRASETPGTTAGQKQVEIGRSITDPDEYLAFAKTLADYDHARGYGEKR